MKITIDSKTLDFIKSKGEKSVVVWLEGCSS
jgi:hypothetical protein